MKPLPDDEVRTHAPAAGCIVEADGSTHCVYPLDNLLEVLGKKWTLLLISVLGNEDAIRFNALQEALPGISPRTLSDRLKELTSLGLVSRNSYDTVPPRVEYGLTDDGLEMREAILPLVRWAEQWRSEPETGGTVNA